MCHWSLNYYAIGSQYAAQPKQTQNPAADSYNLGETKVFNAVRRGFPEVKLKIKTAVRPRQNRGKWFHSFKRYCMLLLLLLLSLHCFSFSLPLHVYHSNLRIKD